MSKGLETATISRDNLEKLIRMSGISEVFDASYYVEANMDVKEALASGVNPFDHFVRSGFLEGRAPFYVRVDKAFYLKENPDVAEAIRQGQFKSAQHHYETMGRQEGRLPTAQAALKQKRGVLSRN